MSTKILKTLTATAVVLALFGCGSSHKHHRSDFTLDVIHMNDLHSQFDGVEGHFTMPAGDTKKSETFYTTFGGYPRVLHKVKDYMAASDKSQTPSLVLNAGDAFQGSIYFQAFKGQANANLLKNMKIDAMAVGNHEFDLGTAALKTLATTVNFPMLASNMDGSKNEDLKGVASIKHYQLFAYKDAKKRAIDKVSDAADGEVVVAVIGVALDDMSDLVSEKKLGGVTFSEEVTSTQKEIDALKQAGVNKIIVLSHIGFAADQALAKNTTGINLIVGGHSHTLLGDFTNIGLSKNDDYAQMVAQKSGDEKTCIVQSGSNAQSVGEVEVHFDKSGKVDSCKGHNTILADDTFYTAEGRFDSDKVNDDKKAAIENYVSGLTAKNLEVVAEDPDLRDQITKDYKKDYEKALGSVVADVKNTMYQIRRPGDVSESGGYQEQSDISCASDTGLRCYHGSQVAPVIGQSFLDWTNSLDVKKVLDLGGSVQIAFVAAGGVRQNINAGKLHSGNISLELIPFSNHLTVLSLTGKQIKDLLKTTITPVLVATAHAGKYPYVAGMRYTFTESAEKDSKGNPQGELSQVQIKGTGTDGKVTWTDIDDANRYNVVLGNYNANGNDGWTAIAEAQVNDSANTNRQDLYVDKSDPNNIVYKAVKVPLTKKTDDKGKTKYVPENEPACKAENEECNTDARAFIYYAKKQKGLGSLHYNTTTLVRRVP